MNRGRRRQHEDDDHGGGRYFAKRQRTTYSQDTKKEEDPIRAVILGAGEKSKSSSMETSIESVAKMLDGDLAQQKAKILQTLVEVVTTLPEKCTIYSTLAGLLNAKNYNFGGEFVESLVKSFKEHLRTGNWAFAQYTLRFISDLVNCHVVSATSLLQLYDIFMEGALEPNVPQVRRDWLVYAILNCLPWVGRELFDKKEQTVERLMITIDNYMKKRNRDHHALLRVWSSDDPHPQEEYLDCLWAQIENLKMNGWIEKHIVRPYISFDSVLCEALQHNLPQITLPPHHENMRYPLPRVVFRMFDYTDCGEGPNAPVLPGAHSIERYLIEQELVEIIRKYNRERRECAAALLEYEYQNRIPLEYMIVEVIFGQLFHLPVPEFLEVFYGCLLIELCKRQAGIIPQILAQTVELLYERLDTMSVSCIDRFATWFAYHLSNFQFRWGWTDWGTAVNMDLDHPKPKFISEVLNKCIRLSYYERIGEMVGPSMASLLPPVAAPQYKYSPETAPPNTIGLTQAKKLQLAFREKIPIEEMLVILREIPNPTDSECESAAHNPLAIEVFSQTLFMLGSKSITHCHAAISKFQPIFKLILDGEEAQLHVLKAAFFVWRYDIQMLSVAIDMLLKYQIVECAAVANWVFMKEMKGEFTRIYLWEILHLTIRKMNKHVARLATELADAREKLRRAELNSSDSEDNEDGDGNGKDKEGNKDVPTEDQVDKMEEKLEAAQGDQKNLFLIVFQRFIMILSEHIALCDTDGVNFNTAWYRWTIGRLQQVFMQHAEQVAQYSSTLETLLFTQDLDKNILEIFHQFQALRA